MNKRTYDEFCFNPVTSASQKRLVFQNDLEKEQEKVWRVVQKRLSNDTRNEQGDEREHGGRHCAFTFLLHVYMYFCEAVH